MIGLEFICANKGIQYKELAEKIGVSRQSITNWVTGRNKIPTYHCMSMSKVFNNISTEWFNKELTESDKVILLDLLDDDNIKKLNEKTNSKRIEVKLFKSQIINNINEYMDYWINKNDIELLEIGKEKLKLIDKFLMIMCTSKVSSKTLKKTLSVLDTNTKEDTEDNFVKSLKLLIEKEEKEIKLKNIITKYIELNPEELNLLKEFGIDNDIPIPFKINKIFEIQRNCEDEEIRKKIQVIKEKLRAINNCSN
ncbi:helix-turn-helix transcriptional regulator [Clostridium perfringens]|nr:helix-turn-helix transcriptional regulator [Clostridium perfringens]ELC8460834.1 helix-turn-helix transcriptional regulator [Clostridium perfringens]